MKFDKVSKEQLEKLLAFIHGDQNFLQDSELPAGPNSYDAYITSATHVDCRAFSLILPPQILPQTDGIAGSGFKYGVTLKLRDRIDLVRGPGIKLPTRIINVIHEIMV